MIGGVYCRSLHRFHRVGVSILWSWFVREEANFINRDASADGGSSQLFVVLSSLQRPLQTEGPPQRNNACDRKAKQQRLQIAERHPPRASGRRRSRSVGFRL
jgi:hypothetical protein